MTSFLLEYISCFLIFNLNISYVLRLNIQLDEIQCQSETPITPRRFTSRFTTFHDGSPNHSTNTNNCQVNCQHPPTCTYICVQPWVSVGKRIKEKDFVNICHHPLLDHLLGGKRSRNEVEMACLWTTNTVNCRQLPTSVAYPRLFVGVSSMVKDV